MADFVSVGKLTDFPSGLMRAREVDGQSVVVLNLKGNLHCFSNVCPHAEGVITEGYVRGDEVVCIYHGAVFDIATGKVNAGVAPRPLPVYAVRVQDEDVQVRLAND